MSQATPTLEADASAPNPLATGNKPSVSEPDTPLAPRVTLFDKLHDAFAKLGVGKTAESAAAQAPEAEESTPATALLPKSAVEQSSAETTKAGLDLERRNKAIEAAKLAREQAAEREELKAQLDEYTQWKKAKAAAKEDPYSWLKLGGFDGPEDFTAAMIDKGLMTPEKQRIIELEEKVLAKEKAEAEVARSQAQTAWQTEYDSHASRIAEKLLKSEKFQLSSMDVGPRMVLNRMIEIAQGLENPELVSEDDLLASAAMDIEKLREAELDKILTLDKVKKKVGASFNTPAASALNNSKSAPRSISSKMAASTVATPTGTKADRIRIVAEELKKQLSRR